MMKRHAIVWFVGGVVMLLLVGGTGAERSLAADAKASPSAAPAAGAAAGKVPTVPVTVVPPPAPAQSAPQKAVSAAAPAPAATVVPTAPQPYNYNPAGKSDPFQPFLEVDLAVKKEKEKRAKEEELRRAAQGKRPISPLQQAEISQFRLVGIAGNDKQRMAMVQDNTAKKIYPLFVGTHIGPNGGRVVSILEDRLIVEEPLAEQPEAATKKKQTRQIPIMLHKEEGKP